MKITIVLGAFFPVPPIMGGAVEKIWFMLTQEFARRGHEVVVISRAMPQFPRQEILAGVKHFRVRGFNAPRSLIWLKLLDLIYSIRTMSVLPKVDIIVTNTFWLPLLLRNSKRGQIYVHATRYPKGQMRFYKKAARLQAPSHAVARAIAAEAPALAQRISVIPNPVPGSANATPSPPLAQREKIVLYVGRVHPEKGVHLLVDAFTKGARTVFADWKLVIVGPAEEKFGGGGEDYLVDLKHRAKEADGRVNFRGAIFDQPALEQEFRAAKLFVYPSLAERGETFGVAPLEAMAHGAAVLTSNLDCFRDFISDHETGFIFNHRVVNPVEALQEKMANVIVDPTLLSRVAEAGYRKSAEYSLTRVADQFLEDFNSLIRTSDAGRNNR
jgi:glycosyltransferase involved in cell wall biosynthesis